jgi:uncharacterized membrane protein
VRVGSVAAAWLVGHTLFTLRDARLYYLGDDGGVDFNQAGLPAHLPRFRLPRRTVGMTYQVSDAELRTRAINLIAGLGKPGS